MFIEKVSQELIKNRIRAFRSSVANNSLEGVRMPEGYLDLAMRYLSDNSLSNQDCKNKLRELALTYPFGNRYVKEN